MSDNVMSYYDKARDAVVIALESGTEIAVLDRAEADSLGNEVLAAARGESTGYEDYFAQQDGAPHVEGSDGSCTDECVATHPDHASSRGEDENGA